MSSRPIVIRADAPLAEAARLLDEHQITGLPVVDPEGLLVGVLSQTDLVRARSTEHLWTSWPGLAVRHLMTTPAFTTRRSASLADVARQMERYHVHRLVVVSDEDPRVVVGVISTGDLVHGMAFEASHEPR
jgi:CBS domain-containing protein